MRTNELTHVNRVEEIFIHKVKSLENEQFSRVFHEWRVGE
jgi:hypothetical protein